MIAQLATSQNLAQRREPMRWARVVMLLISIAIVPILGLTGCAPSSTKPSTPRFNLPAKDLDNWTLPSDIFTMTSAQVWASDDAENVLVSDCMGRAGYAYYPPVMHGEYQRAATTDATGTRQIFNPTIAARWGYENAPSNARAKAAGRAFKARHDLSKAESNRLDTCVDKIAHSTSVGDYDTNLSNMAQNWYLDAQAKAANLKRSQKAAAKWHACMLPQGISGLPSSPLVMPTSAILEGVQGPAADMSPLAREPTSQEIKLASGDANCRRSSGWDAAMYNGEWNILYAHMVKESGQVEAAMKQNAKVANDSNKILATYHPKSGN